MDFFDALVRYETRLWNVLDTRLAEAGGARLAQWKALRIIDDAAGECRVLEIQSSLLITVGAASKLVDRLEAAGYVERSANPADRRSSLIAVTDTGRSALHAANTVVTTALSEYLGGADLRGLTEALVGLDERLGSRRVPATGGIMTHQPHRVDISFAQLPSGSVESRVQAAAVRIDDRDAVRVQLPADVELHGTPGVDFIDQRTFLELPIEFESGVLTVDVRSGLSATAPPDARAFVGLAFAVTPESFESVYLRPLNGRSLAPEPPRSERAVQYFAYPQWDFQKLRDTFPGDFFEAGADIAPNRWTQLRLSVQPERIDVEVDGVRVLTVTERLTDPRSGHLGLFVDIGTVAYFSNLVVEAD
ncbi:MAG TPA: MarR family transcriptional regulator [Propionibacteriaceae bacterium]|nr:MarR family transcriptional regulator [Propionibacteriaceae bacterium]